MGWWNRKYDLALWRRAAIASSTSLRTLFGSRPVLKLSRKIAEWRIDLVHTSTSLTIAGALAARVSRKPHIWHVREWIGQRGLFRFWLPDPWLVRVFNMLADRIASESHFAGSVFFEQGAARNVNVIYDGVDCADYDRPDAGCDLRRSLNVEPKEILVAMVANLGATMKRHDVFIEMSARLAPLFPCTRFVVFGQEPRGGSRLHDSGSRYAANLKRLVSSLGLGERFIWAGFQENIPEMMAALDILVHPCEVEGFGRIAIEAMAARRPVVGPNRGGISETVVDGHTGFLVEPGNVSGFADSLARLLRDGELRRRMGEQARRHVEENFSLQQHVRQVTSLYEEVLSDHKRREAGSLNALRK
jgi:glycosyltransferase involved in cell wall biosynthesis